MKRLRRGEDNVWSVPSAFLGGCDPAEVYFRIGQSSAGSKGHADEAVRSTTGMPILRSGVLRPISVPGVHHHHRIHP